MAKKTKTDKPARDPFRALLGSATVPVILSFPHLHEPHAFEEGDRPKYSARFIISKDDDATIGRLKKAHRACYDANKESKLGGLPLSSKKLHNPFHDGDEELEDNPEREEYENTIFINASSQSPVVCFDEDGGEIIDIANELYAGCNVRAEVKAFAFDGGGNKGIGFFLNSVKKVDDEGERLGGVEASHDVYEDDDEEDDDGII